MTLKPSDLKLMQPPRYHRNGVSGDGFYAVFFGLREGRAWRHLIATVPGGLDENPEPGVRVVDPADRDACWRGDEMAPWLVDRCREASASWDAYCGLEQIKAGIPASIRAQSAASGEAASGSASANAAASDSALTSSGQSA